MKEESERSRKRRYQRNGKGHDGLHHIIPASRGGSDEPSNLYYRQGDWAGAYALKHTAWHALFANDLPEEAVARILTWQRKDGELDMRYFRSRRGVNEQKLHWWKILFGDRKPQEAAEWVMREFLRKEWQ